MLGSTLSNDPLADKRFDFQFVNPPYDYERSKDYDAVTTREHRQNNPRVCQRLGQRGLKPETLPPPLPSSFSLATLQRGQLGDEARATIRDFRTLRFERSIP
jgi:hypothetical protein